MKRGWDGALRQLRSRWRYARSWTVVRPALLTAGVVGAVMCVVTLGRDLALPWNGRLMAGALAAFAVPFCVSLYSRSAALAAPLAFPVGTPLRHAFLQGRLWVGVLGVAAAAGTALLWVSEWRLQANLTAMESPILRGALIYLVPAATSLYGRMRVLERQCARLP